MGDYGNCKYLPMFQFVHVKYAFGYGFWLYYIGLSYDMCGVNVALV